MFSQVIKTKAIWDKIYNGLPYFLKEVNLKMCKKIIVLCLVIGLMGVNITIWAEDDVAKKEKGGEQKEKTKGREMSIQATQGSGTVPSVEELEKARKDREERLKEAGYIPPAPQDVPVSEKDMQEANKARQEMLKKMRIDPNAPKTKTFLGKEPTVSAQEIEKANKDRQERLKEAGYTPPAPFDVPVSEKDMQEANKARQEMLKKMGIDPNAPKKAEIPSWYKPIEPTKEQLEKDYNLQRQKQIDYQKKLFDEAMEYKEKGELEKSLATFEKMEGTGNSPIIEEAVKEMTKIKQELELLEQVEEPKKSDVGWRVLSPEEVPEQIKNHPEKLRLIKEKKEREKKEKLKDEE